MRSWPVSTRLSSRSTSRSALHWTVGGQHSSVHSGTAPWCTKQQSITQHGTVQISRKHHSSGQHYRVQKRNNWAQQDRMLSNTLQHGVSFVFTDKYRIVHHRIIETTKVHWSHCCFKNIFISVLSSCWLKTCVFLSSSRSSRPWNSSRNLQRRSVVWSSSSRTSWKRSRRGIGESSMFAALASEAKSAPERVRARHRHYHHLSTISSGISDSESPRQ